MGNSVRVQQVAYAREPGKGSAEPAGAVMGQ